ncbi:hypothetical protein NHX12_018161 [Muraenolepis orangiensis]|uniref:ELMO domain-containing protein n=1 Tax=Muraenolepis orangiensis TaxID=630683 RepID=A0A9Q0IXS8_9TELE|nr:hypothetical protein NHX12_018161 [Muraenolepis orangiensis]
MEQEMCYNAREDESCLCAVEYVQRLALESGAVQSAKRDSGDNKVSNHHQLEWTLGETWFHNMRMLGYIWEYVYASFLRYWLKWAARQVTGSCELQRICTGFQPGATRTSKAEYSLQFSKNKITGYASLYTCVEDLRKETFSSDNMGHEDMLLKLWKLLMPAVKLESRVTKQWGDIGFQGDDPKTDFRGMGMLGLTNLVFFSEHYTEEARQVLSHANHPKLGYSYAIVGINLTEMAYSLLKSGDLKPHFYNTVTEHPELHHFHHLYCYLAYEFDKFWVASKPQSIMEFNHYREKFHSHVKVSLQQPGVALKLTGFSQH